jgi:uncharacterized protein DUF6632
MNEEKRTLWLRIVMIATGAFLVLLLPFMFDLWPGGFRWAHPSMHPPYERMIIAVYWSLGVCLLVASRDPARHAILIDFTILSSILHGAVMTYDSFAQDQEMTHLVGDVPILFGLAALLVWLHPRRALPAAPGAATPSATAPV